MTSGIYFPSTPATLTLDTQGSLPKKYTNMYASSIFEYLHTLTHRISESNRPSILYFPNLHIYAADTPDMYQFLEYITTSFSTTCPILFIFSTISTLELPEEYISLFTHVLPFGPVTMSTRPHVLRYYIEPVYKSFTWDHYTTLSSAFHGIPIYQIHHICTTFKSLLTTGQQIGSSTTDLLQQCINYTNSYTTKHTQTTNS